MVSVLHQSNSAKVNVQIERNDRTDWSKFLVRLERILDFPVRRVFLYDSPTEFTNVLSVIEAAKRYSAQKEASSTWSWVLASPSLNPLPLQVTDGGEWRRQYYQFGDYLLKPAFRLFTGSSSALLEPPQPPKRPLVGNLFDFLPNVWLNSIHLHEQYGGIYKLELGSLVIYIVKDVDMLEQVFNIPDKRFPTTTFGQPTIACKGVFIADGNRWEFGRDALQKELTSETVNALVPEFAKFARELYRTIQPELPGTT